MRVIMLGPPGAGKGTQSALLAAWKGVPHISTGEMMRAAVAAKSKLGLELKGYLDRGQLVPDETVTALVQERLGMADCGTGFVLDGYPRTVAQSEALEGILKSARIGGKEPSNSAHSHAISLVVPEQALIERIKQRGASGSGRSDDSADVAIERLQVYLRETAPVLEFYRARPGFYEVDGTGSIDQVQSRIFSLF